jgi:hypothetical protein
MTIRKKILMVALMTGMGSRVLQAQEEFVSPQPPPPKRVNVTHSPQFWTPFTIALVTIDAAAKAGDAYATRRNLDSGGKEHDPIARPFVHTPSVQVVATAALLGAEIAAAYCLHRRGQTNRGRAVLMGGTVLNGLGTAFSIENRGKAW